MVAGNSARSEITPMLFQFDQAPRALLDGALERAVKARDANATVWIDAGSGRVRIEGSLTPEQAADAFREAGLLSKPVTDLGGGCCGGCCG